MLLLNEASVMFSPLVQLSNVRQMLWVLLQLSLGAVMACPLQARLMNSQCVERNGPHGAQLLPE